MLSRDSVKPPGPPLADVNTLASVGKGAASPFTSPPFCPSTPTRSFLFGFSVLICHSTGYFFLVSSDWEQPGVLPLSDV